MSHNCQSALHGFFASQLFHDVQMSGLFADSKTFADAEPKSSFVEVIEAYDKAKNIGEVDLATFVSEHFVLPEFNEILANQHAEGVFKQIEYLWSILQKPADSTKFSSLIPLEKPYTVPGGRFREVYYWDSYFAALGLLQSGHIAAIEDLVDNFISIQCRVGCIPNGNRWYYSSRSQPPVLAMLVQLLQDNSKVSDTKLTEYIEAVQSEYEFWMQGSEHLAKGLSHRRVVCLTNGAILNRYYDDDASPRPESYLEDIELAESLTEQEKPNFYRNIRAACESGWDFSSRWLKDKDDLLSIATTELIPVDLNCLLYFVENWLSKTLSDKDKLKSEHYLQAAQARLQAMNEYLWNEEAQLFSDYWFSKNSHSKVKSLAGVWPLFMNLASPLQAQKVARTIEQEFLKQGGLITTTTETKQQWDSPNGWAPLHWVTVKGLQYYGYDKLASDITNAWLANVTLMYEKTGKLMEKYNVLEPEFKADGGEYDVQEGFGWTNGVTLALHKL